VLAKAAVRANGVVVVLASQGHAGEPFPRPHGTSESITAASTVPALVVRDPRPWQAWARGERVLRVLLAVDVTQTCRPAIEWVKTLCAAGGCHVTVTQVYYAGEAAQQYGVRGKISHVESDPTIERLIARDLSKRVGSVLGHDLVEYRPQLGLGRIGDHVLDAADRASADLVVVGTHRKHGLRRLSSVASVVMHYGRAAVACVPRGAQSTTAGVSLVERVLVATDFSDLSNQAIPYAYALLGHQGGHVHLLHVAVPTPDHNDGPQLAERLRHLVPPDPPDSGIETVSEVARSEDPAEAIVSTARRIGADVICLSSHGRTGLSRLVVGSVAESVLRRSPCPVFVVRPLRD
jgi:nucleotide-binding universal stress UspA family protein